MQKSDFYRDARRDLAGPLQGMRVLEATTSWAGPMCGCLFADLGADIIKVEAPEGEVGRRVPPYLTGEQSRISFLHATVNRNKRSLTLDLRHPEARDIFLKHAGRSDIVVQNFRTATFDRWGIGYEHCRRVKPDIIYVSISGFGQFGPDHDRPGYDPVAEAASGFMSLNGSPDGGPVRCATYLGDDLAGLHGALSALAALRHRDLTGEGQHIDVSLMDSILFQSNGYLTLGALGHPALRRLGNRSLFSAPVDAFECTDGHVFLAVLLEPHWRALARIIGHPEMIDDPRFSTMEARHQNREATDAAVAAWIKTRSAGDVEKELTLAGIPVAAVRTYAEAARNPHVIERDMLQQIEQEDGKMVPLTGPAAKFSRTPTRVRSRAARLGEHTEVILEELGIAAPVRERLHQAKII